MNDSLTYDTEGIDLTEDAEGCRLSSYPDPGTGGAPWTVGYGHTGPEVEEGMQITHDQATEFLKGDVKSSEAAVKRYVEVPLSQGQYDALVDFAFNAGAGNLQHSTLLRKVNASDFAGAAEEFGKWVNGGGHVLPGLVRRRHAESQVFAQA
jgi:lysozyme